MKKEDIKTNAKKIATAAAIYAAIFSLIGITNTVNSFYFVVDADSPILKNHNVSNQLVDMPIITQERSS